MTHPPHLIITIDTEEEFDWNAPFCRHNYSVENIFEHQKMMADFYNHHNITPIMATSYPLLQDEKSSAFLKNIFHAGHAIPATHLHPWVTPPFEEKLTSSNSYAGNLPITLEREKIKILTTQFENTIGMRPVIYKAGRYGIGPNTDEILAEYGYKYDLSYFARRSFTKNGGFDYSHIDSKPFKSQYNITHFPVTGFYTGFLSHLPFVQQAVQKEYIYGLKIRGLLARFNMCDYISLTPEGVDLKQMKYLTDYALKQNICILQITYHSSIFLTGATHFVRTHDDVLYYTKTIQDYIIYFKSLGGTIGGIPEMDLYTTNYKDKTLHQSLTQNT